MENEIRDGWVYNPETGYIKPVDGSIHPKSDQAHLVWLHQRIVHVYKESINTDFLYRLREIISVANKTV